MYYEGHGKDRKMLARIDITKATQVDDVNLDDEVTIVIKGKVKELRGPSEYMGTEYLSKGKEKEVKRMTPGEVVLEIGTLTVATDGKFDGMMDKD